jgi:hypothetical protein
MRNPTNPHIEGQGARLSIFTRQIVTLVATVRIDQVSLSLQTQEFGGTLTTGAYFAKVSGVSESKSDCQFEQRSISGILFCGVCR